MIILFKILVKRSWNVLSDKSPKAAAFAETVCMKLVNNVILYVIVYAIINVISILFLGHGVRLDTDSGSDSESESNKEVKDKGKAVSLGNSSLIDRLMSNVDMNEVSKKAIPSSSLGTAASHQARANSLLLERVAGTIRNLEHTIRERNLMNIPYSELSDENKELLDKHRSEVKFAAEQSKRTMLSADQAIRDLNNYKASVSKSADAPMDTSMVESSSAAAKRSLSEASPVSSSKKISFDTQGDWRTFEYTPLSYPSSMPVPKVDLMSMPMHKPVVPDFNPSLPGSTPEVLNEDPTSRRSSSEISDKDRPRKLSPKGGNDPFKDSNYRW